MGDILPFAELQINGGEAESLAAAGAALDRTPHPPPIAELLGGLDRLALAEIVAHLARGEHHAVARHRLDDVDAEPELLAERLELGRRAGAALAIGEIIANHDMVGPEPLGYHL